MSAEIKVSSGRYKIIKELGRGGMAIVYQAEQTDQHRTVALKVLPPQLMLDETFVRRFLHEARTASALDHPNIVPVYDFGEQEGTYYIAMRFVNGEALSARLAREHKMPLAETIRVLQPIADALDYAHARGIVHRDVKPANIMIEPDGTPVLMDFGIAKAADMTQLTRSGMMMGTPKYMAPEQVTGKSADARTDIYALGVVCYEMLAGRPPFEGETPTILHAHAYETPPPLRTLNSDIPEIVAAVIEKALAKDPEERYQSPSTFIQDLEKAQAGTLIMPPRPARLAAEAPTGAMPAPPVPAKKHALALPLGIVGILIVLAVGGWLAFPAMRGSPQLAFLFPATATPPLPATATVPPTLAPIPPTPTLIPTETPIPTRTPTPFPPGKYAVTKCVTTLPLGSEDVKMIWCAVGLEILPDGKMKISTTWRPEFDPALGQLHKSSDKGNKFMYLKDNLGNRYDQLDAGAAAAEAMLLDTGQTIEGWFVFPPAHPGATTFIFQNDDQHVAIEGIELK
jgi:serine/threonine-protein kinase